MLRFKIDLSGFNPFPGVAGMAPYYIINAVFLKLLSVLQNNCRKLQDN
jgi:hypothetical protein